METEKKYGKDIADILKQTKHDKILFRAYLVSQDYSWLALVTHVRAHRNSSNFMLDCPKDFRQDVTDIKDCRLDFKFTGKDTVPYKFSAFGIKIVKNGLLVNFPEFIERIQKRRFFRLATPSRMKIHFQWEAKTFKMDVVNLSQGGLLAMLVVNRKIVKYLFLEKGEVLAHLLIEFSGEKKDLQIHINKAEVRREEYNSRTDRHCYALEFTEINESELFALTELLYNFQRDLLRRRWLVKSASI
jgi:c-di-GMP-binding flagellar brake protein YcgR